MNGARCAWLAGIAAVFSTTVATTARAEAPWVDGLTLPDFVKPYDGTLQSHDFDEGVFLVGEQEVPKRGLFRSQFLTRLPEGFHEPADAAIKKWESALKTQGWQLKGHHAELYAFVQNAKGHERWLALSLAEYQDPKLTWVQLGAAPKKFDVVAPSAKSEPVADSAEWPFLKAFADSKLEATLPRDEPLDVTVNGLDREPHLVGRGHVTKAYTPPSSLSRLEFELAWRAALTKAGWAVLPLPDGTKEGAEGIVRAHWQKNGRELWAVLSRAADETTSGMTFSLADSGADDWALALGKECRLPLYGVTFDFDKATLKATATPVLDKAAAALKANPSLSVEVQGHTDDVGDDAYNVTLSGQRADAVRAWLSAHGVAANRLTSRGYGKSQPVVENTSDANRARNRRVELRCQKDLK